MTQSKSQQLVKRIEKKDRKSRFSLYLLGFLLFIFFFITTWVVYYKQRQDIQNLTSTVEQQGRALNCALLILPEDRTPAKIEKCKKDNAESPPKNRNGNSEPTFSPPTSYMQVPVSSQLTPTQVKDFRSEDSPPPQKPNNPKPQPKPEPQQPVRRTLSRVVDGVLQCQYEGDSIWLISLNGKDCEGI